MRIHLKEKNSKYSTCSLLHNYCYELVDKVHFLIDNEDFDRIKDLEFGVEKTMFNGKGANVIFIYKNKKKCGTLAKFLINSDKRTYLRDSYTNKGPINYRKENISTSIKDIVGFDGFRKDKSRKNGIFRLNYEIVEKIREEYKSGECTQFELGIKYDISRSNLSYLLNYKTWVGKEDSTLRKYKESNSIKINNLVPTNQYNIYDEMERRYKLLILQKEKIKIYIEKLPTNRLVYVEFIDANNVTIFKADLYIPETDTFTYSICSKYPRKTENSIIESNMNVFKFINQTYLK